MHGQDAYLTLAQAGRNAPGQPSPNCLWRWCRKGVIARNGQRVRLQHVRIGGKLYTTARWIEEFGLRLAQADAEYFDLDERAAPPPRTRRCSSRHPRSEERQAAIDRAERELAEAGI